MSTSQPMNTSEIIQAITPLVEMFERLGIAYYVGGSVASSLHGRRRATQDVDLVADIQAMHVQTLVKLLSNDYYIDADMIRDALRLRSSFNVMHNDTGMKVDVFIPKQTPLAQQEMRRAKEEIIDPSARPFSCASPEDVILNKLAWWKLGGGSSSRQWSDLIEVIKRQAATLDTNYLRQSAPQAGVADILEQAFADAGLSLP